MAVGGYFPIWTEDEIKILKENYLKLTNKDLQKLLPGRSESALRTAAQKYRCAGAIGRGRPDKATINHSFFSELNLASAYWAGYIAADGYLGRDRSRIRLSCSSKDEELLLNFKEATQCTYPIKTLKERVETYKNNKTYISKQQTYLTFTSTQIWSDLHSVWNLHTNKSLTLKPPNITDQNLICSYIIGFTDGDGSVSMCDNSVNFAISWTSTHEMLEWIIEHFTKMCPQLKWGCKPHKNKGKNAYSLTFHRKKGRIIYQTLKDSVQIPWKLKRKWWVNWDVNLSL